jgi:phospholipid transport system substrate-binding protein
MTFHRAPIFAILILLVAPGTALATLPPDQSIRAATENLQAEIRQRHQEYMAHPEKFRAMVDQIVVPHFDQDSISQLVLGRHWKDATDGQRTRFSLAFKNSLVHTYAGALLQYHDSVKLDWKQTPAQPEEKQATVRADLLRQNGPPVPLTFSVRLVRGEWKIYDVAVEGVSLAANFRAQFSSEIRRSGLDGLIQRLEDGGSPLQDQAAGRSK